MRLIRLLAVTVVCAASFAGVAAAAPVIITINGTPMTI